MTNELDPAYIAANMTHTCNGCGECIPELSPQYWRKRAHQAEEHAEALEEHSKMLIRRCEELCREVDHLSAQVARFGL